MSMVYIFFSICSTLSLIEMVDHDVAIFRFAHLLYYWFRQRDKSCLSYPPHNTLSGPSLVGYSGYIGQSWSRLYNFRFALFQFGSNDESQSLRQLHEFACLTQIRQRAKERERQLGETKKERAGWRVTRIMNLKCKYRSVWCIQNHSGHISYTAQTYQLKFSRVWVKVNVLRVSVSVSVNECVAFYWQLAKYKDTTPTHPDHTQVRSYLYYAMLLSELCMFSVICFAHIFFCFGIDVRTGLIFYIYM